MPSIKKAFTGGLLLIGDSIGKKLIGLLSTLLLARLLTPDDYGIVALATIAFGLVEILSNTGGSKYLLTREKVDKVMLNTAFTLDVLVKSVFSIAFLLSANFLADILGDDRLSNVFVAMSLVIFMTGFSNPGVILLTREQEYKKIVTVTIISKVISVVFAVTIALIYKNYWALIAGQALAYILPVLGGYIICNYKPALGLSNFKHQFKYSGWLMPSSVFSYLRGNVDIFLINRLFDTTVVGGYHVMKYLAYMPVAFFIGPMTAPLFAQLAHLKNNENYFNKMHDASVYITCVVAAPISMFIFFFSEEIVSFVLGSKWLESHHLLSIFSVMVFLTPFFNQVMNVSFIKSRTSFLFVIEFFMLIATVLVLTIFNYENHFIFASTKVVLDFSFIIVVTLLTNLLFGRKGTSLKVLLTVSPVIFICYLSAKLAEILYLDVSITSVNLKNFLALACLGIVYAASYIVLLFFILIIFKRWFAEIEYVHRFLFKAINSIRFLGEKG